MAANPTRTTSDISSAQPQSNATFIVGGGPVGREVATRIADIGGKVTILDRPSPADPPPGGSVRSVDTFDASSLNAANFGDATHALILGPDDATNLLIAQLARTKFDIDRVVVRVNDPERIPAFERLGVETIDVAAVIGCAVTERW